MNLSIENLKNNNLLSEVGAYTNESILFAKAVALQIENYYESFDELYHALYKECDTSEALTLNERYYNDAEAGEEFFQETQIRADGLEWLEEEEEEMYNRQ